jgi:hypothetical protein
MGSGVTNFLSTVEVQSIGTADIDKMAAAIDKQSASLDKLGLSANKVNEHPGFSDFAAKVKQGLSDPLGAFGSSAESALRAMGPLGAGVAATGGVLAAAGLAAFEAAKSLGDYATQIENTALRTGLTTKEVSLFSFAAKAAGQDVTVFESAMRKLSQGLEDNSSVGKIAREGLSELGVAAYGADGKLRPMSEIFLQISKGLNGIEDPAKRNAEVLKVFGRAGIELLPTILGLADNLQRAKDIGLGVSDADIKRWEEYHKQIAAVEAQWDLLARAFKEPMASVLMVTIKGVMGDNSDVTAAAVQALKGQIGKLSPDEAQGRLDFLRNSGMVPKNTQQELQDQINHAADKNLFAPQRQWQNTGISVMGYQSGAVAFDLSGYTRQVNDALSGSGDKGKLEDEKKKLASLQDELRAKQELKAPLTQQSELAGQVTAQRAVVEGIEARIKATKDLAAEQKALLELDKQSSEIFLKAMSAGGTAGEKYNEAISKIEVERQSWFESHPGGSPADQTKANFDFNKQAGAATMTRDEEWRKALIDGDKKGQELVKTYLEGIDKASREGVKAGEDFYKEHPEIFGMRPQDRQFLTGLASPEQALRDAHDNERRALGLYGGQAALAGIPEITQARTLEALRKNAADEEYRALSRKAAITNDIQAEQDAIDQQHQKYLDAEIERQQALLQMALRQKQEFQSLVVGGVEALIHGQAAAFGQHFATDLLDKVIGNAAGMVWKDVSKIIPHANNPNSKIGQALQGTLFGADPLKGATDINTVATNLNTKALDDLTALLAAARANALSVSGGGGGGFSNAAGTFARIMAGAGFTPASSANWGSGLEVIGGGDSTAGLTQLPSGLWQRGPAGSDAASGAGVAEPDYMPADLIQGGVGFPKNDPNAWMRGSGMTVGKGVGYAAGGIAAAFGAYSGFKAGGAQGDLMGASSILGGASMIPGPQQPFIMAAALVTGLIGSLLGDPKKNRANEIDTWLQQHQFRMPDPVSIERDTRGRDVSYNMQGNLQPIQQTVNNHYDSSTHVGTLSALDSQDVSRFFDKNAAAVNKGVARAIDEGGAMVPKLASAMGLQ